MVKSYSNKNLFLFFIIVFSLLCLIFYFFYLNHQVEGMSIILNGESTLYVPVVEINKDGYLNGIDVVYYINLDRSTTRRNEMDNLLQNSMFHSIPTIRFPAYDGKKKDMSKYFVIENIGNIDNSSIENTEYACSLSHLETIRSFSESPYNIALILEDDVTLDYTIFWKKSLREIIDGAPNDWEIIQLCYILNGNFPVKEYTLNDLNNSSKYYSTAAYIINKTSANKINNIHINNKYYLNNKYSHEADNLIFNLFTTYTYKYPYFTYKSNNFSTIHPEHNEMHENSKNRITSFLDSFSHQDDVDNK